MTPLVLTSSGETAAEIPSPRQDYLLLADVLKGKLSYPPKSDNSLLARIEKKTAADLRQAFAALRLRRTVSVYVSLSEKIGLPLSLLLPRSRHSRPAHVLIAHHLTSTKKRSLHQRTGYLHRFERVIALCDAQTRYLTEEAGLSPSRGVRVYDSTDTTFWTPQPITRGAGDPPYILSAGREKRDYETLAKAMHLLPDLQSIVCASSPWSRQTDQAGGERPPENITFRRGLSYAELRQLYANASGIVVPVYAGTDYAAGINGVLEGMAMRKPVLASLTPGLAEYLTEDRTITVPAGDASAMAEGIRSLLSDKERIERLAASGHHFVQTEGNVDTYVSRVAQLVLEAESDRH